MCVRFGGWAPYPKRVVVRVRETVAANLARLTASRRLSHAAFAQRAACGRGHVRAVLRGVRPCSVDHLARFGWVLEVDAAGLLETEAPVNVGPPPDMYVVRRALVPLYGGAGVAAPSDR